MRISEHDWQLRWLVGFLVATYAAAGLGSLFTFPALDAWYRGLRRPGWSPPDWLFGPVWTILYGQMAVAAWLVRRSRGKGHRAARVALFTWCAQLLLNLGWSAAFFGARSTLAGVWVIVVLWTTIVATVAQAWRLSRPAGLLLLPYLAWTSFAALLNVTIWRMNRHRDS